MLNVVTVHWQDARWIEPQLRFLRRNLRVEHRVFASLNGVDPALASSFHFAAELEGNPADRLNALAEIVREDSEPDDLLLFLDGDAFPIAPIGPELLGAYPLVAIRRDENGGDCQPHQSFCLTSVRFWNDIGGDWSRGYKWRSSTGEMVTDVGGNLLGILRERGIEWRPLLRSNRFNLDPLWFGVYGDVAYHHGAGFRTPIARRVDLLTREQRRNATAGAVIPASVPLLGRAERSARYRIAGLRRRRELTRHARASRRISEEVFRRIEHDDEFYREFLEGDPAAESTTEGRPA